MRSYLGIGLVFLMVGCVGSGRAEGLCFRTADQAARQTGDLELSGFRLIYAKVDPFVGRSWSYVRSCAHPEYPLLAMSMGLSREAILAAVAKTRTVEQPVVTVGKRVRVVEVTAVSRLDVTGVVQNNGAVGDVVWVRLVTPENQGQDSTPERMVQVTVRSGEQVEMN